MTAISKNVYFDVLDDIVDKYNNTVHRTIKLSGVVKNDVVKKTVFNKLVAKVNNMDTSNFVLKTKYQTDKTELENKISDSSGLVTILKLLK